MPRTAPTPTRRCIHLVDIENLLGGWVTDQRTRHLVARYHSTGLIGSADLVIVAGAHRAAARWAFAAPQGWRRIITADRPDAADDALVKAGQAYRLLADHPPGDRLGRPLLHSRGREGPGGRSADPRPDR